MTIGSPQQQVIVANISDENSKRARTLCAFRPFSVGSAP